MNLSAPFILRPVATLLLSVAILLLGGISYGLLPVSPLPKMDFPAITITANLPGASPQVMASTVATPLERALGSIAGISEMTSRSSQGNTRIIILFDIGRNIDSAAREVQAAINKARPLLPSGMKNMPTYRKINPSQSPIMVLAMTSDTMSRAQLRDIANNIVSQKIAQVSGVGEVLIGGGGTPAVRVSVQPRQLDHYGIALDEVRETISAATAQRPKGAIENDTRHWQIQANDQLYQAKDYANLVIREENGAILRLSDIATVKDDVEDRYNAGYFNNQNAILLVVNRQANANIIETIDAIRTQLPELRAVMPEAANLDIALDRSPVIRATLHEAERTLIIATGLVILVVLAFLGRWRAALIPALAVPVSLVGTFAVMYLWGFSLNNFSLMALIIATGLVVDDAIVVLENIARHMESGEPPLEAALKGTREVGFTLLSMNLSLVAVFLSILFMGGFVANLFREFSITLTAAILVSLVVSLTLTPMLCARWLRVEEKREPGRFARIGHRVQTIVMDRYARSLDWSLRHSTLMLLGLVATIVLNVYLYIAVPKTFMPSQDTGQITGFIRGEDGLSFSVMQPKMEAYRKLLVSDPAVAAVAGFVGGQTGVGNATVLIRLKELDERKESVDAVIERLRKNAPKIPGAKMYLMASQDLQFGGRQDRGTENEYVLLANDLDALRTWVPRVRDALAALPELQNVDTTDGKGAQQVRIVIDRENAKRLGIDVEMVTAVLNNAFSQRQIATIYDNMYQYQVVMEIDPKYATGPEVLSQVKVITDNGDRIPLSTIARWEPSLEQDRVSHHGQFADESIEFTLAEGVSLDQATAAVNRAVAGVGLPNEVQGMMGGTGSAFVEAQQGQPFMILAALVLVYLVLGVLYESYIHPLTILSTLPSAGVGALLAIQLFGQEFSLISLLGLFLLIGVVKKNAILMIDLALQLERHDSLSPIESIRRACLLRFRPIMMTTLAALFGALPLLLDTSEGSETRHPLGVAIVGGLILSQLLTLYSTPVVYVFFDRLRHRFNRWRGARTDAALENPL
ncbi:efflux RND transporter permease subunit [Pseudomonas matsuisoli]|uniref:Acriflavine resistance protein B n=1 Tax=Pseudomonas matsuisoli TaxID=1515666 RepID=A0A917UUI0_9PSED|nr:efflux RND transporter permease subunit [Pseudomonas matsuisoli]GGJ86069.1 acriflavine resistance protein B [Pseudomonas matsuisoli]